MSRHQILREVSAERDRQHEKFGDQSGMGRMFMLAVLGEEFGEACKEAVEEVFAATSKLPTAAADRRRRLRDELVQVAAVAVQIIEHIDAEETE